MWHPNPLRVGVVAGVIAYCAVVWFAAGIVVHFVFGG